MSDLLEKLSTPITADAYISLGHMARVMNKERKEAADEIKRLREALDAAHYYIDASDFELKLEGITRDDTLSKARELREAVWGWKHRAALGEGKE